MGNCVCSGITTVSIIPLTGSYCNTEMSYHIEERNGWSIYGCLNKSMGRHGYKIIQCLNDYKCILSNDNRISDNIFVCIEDHLAYRNKLYLVLNCQKFDINMDNVKKFYNIYTAYISKFKEISDYIPPLQYNYYYCNKIYYNNNLLSMRNKKLYDNLNGIDDIKLSRNSINNILYLFGASLGLPDLYDIKTGSKHIIGSSEQISYYNRTSEINVIIENTITNDKKQQFINYIISNYGAKKFSSQVKDIITKKIIFININNVLSKLFTSNSHVITKIDNILNYDIL